MFLRIPLAEGFLRVLSRIVVEIMPKRELLDPQGKATGQALVRAGHMDFGDVRIGKRIEISVCGEVTRELLAEAGVLAETVLSNSVIEDVVAVYAADDGGGVAGAAAEACGGAL